jgi:hypothetical protein
LPVGQLDAQLAQHSSQSDLTQHDYAEEELDQPGCIVGCALRYGICRYTLRKYIKVYFGSRPFIMPAEVASRPHP